MGRAAAQKPMDADVHVVFLPALLPKATRRLGQVETGAIGQYNADPVPYSFDAFGRYCSAMSWSVMALTPYVVVAVLCFRLPAVAPVAYPGLDVSHSAAEKARYLPEDGDAQVVFLPALPPKATRRSGQAEAGASGKHNDEPMLYKFDAFGRNFELQLVPNRRLLSEHFSVWINEEQNDQLSSVNASCHFVHSGQDSIAALSSCKENEFNGLIVADNSTYVVEPMPAGSRRSGDSSGRMAHMIKRVPLPKPPEDDTFILPPSIHSGRRMQSFVRKPGPEGYTIEIAVFFDKAAYNMYLPYFNYSEADLRDMILADINAVQALYYDQSLGMKFQLSLVRVTLLSKQPAALTTNAEKELLLFSFCSYQNSINVPDDNNPQHWDLALLFTGLDIYSYDKGILQTSTLGVAPVGSVCRPKYACVSTEIGPRGSSTGGLIHAYTLAHEIGHSLGMNHDGDNNTCPSRGYIMAAYRTYQGGITWSNCSANTVANMQSKGSCLLDGATDDYNTPKDFHHEKYMEAPGFFWNAKKQCEILLRDKHAVEFVADGRLADVCVELLCLAPNNTGPFSAGAAIPGTVCGDHKWCQGGECVLAKDLSIFTKNATTKVFDVTKN